MGALFAMSTSKLGDRAKAGFLMGSVFRFLSTVNRRSAMSCSKVLLPFDHGREIVAQHAENWGRERQQHPLDGPCFRDNLAQRQRAALAAG